MQRTTVILVWVVLLAGNPLRALPLRDHSGVIFGSDFLRILDPRVRSNSGDDPSDGPRAGMMITPELPPAEDPSRHTDETKTVIEVPDSQPLTGNLMLSSRYLRKLDPFVASSVFPNEYSSSLLEIQKLRSRKMPEDTAVTNLLKPRRKFVASSSNTVKPNSRPASALVGERNDHSRLTVANDPGSDFLLPYDDFDYSNYYYLDDLYPLASSALENTGTASATFLRTSTLASSQGSTIAVSRFVTPGVTRGSSTISPTTTILSPVSSRRPDKEIYPLSSRRPEKEAVRSRDTTFTNLAATPTATINTPLMTAIPETTTRTTTTKRPTTKRSTFRYQTTTDSTPSDSLTTKTSRFAIESKSRKSSFLKDRSSASTLENQGPLESTTLAEKSGVTTSVNTPRPRTSVTVRASTLLSQPPPTTSPLTHEINTDRVTTKSPVNATNSPVSRVHDSAQRPQISRNNVRHFRYTTPIPKPKKSDLENVTNTPELVPNKDIPQKNLGSTSSSVTSTPEPVPNEDIPKKSLGSMSSSVTSTPEPVSKEDIPKKNLGSTSSSVTSTPEPVHNEDIPKKNLGSTSSSSIVVEVRVESPARDPRVLPAADASPRVQTVDRGPTKVTPAPPSKTVHTVLPDRHTTSFLLSDPLMVDVAAGPTTSRQDPYTMPADAGPSALPRARNSGTTSTRTTTSEATTTISTTTESPKTTTTGAPKTLPPRQPRQDEAQDLSSNKAVQGFQANREKDRSVQFQTSVVEVSGSVGLDSYTLTKDPTDTSHQKSQPINQSANEGASDNLTQRKSNEFQSQSVSTSVSRTEAHTAERVSSISIYERLPKQTTRKGRQSTTTPQPSNVTDTGAIITTNNTEAREKLPPIGSPKAQQGLAPLGLAPFGEAPEGLAPFGHAPEGVAPYGLEPSGVNPHGLAPQGLIPEGAEFLDMNITANVTQGNSTRITFVDATLSGGADANSTVGYVVEEHNVSRFRLEEKTPDGFIIGEYGVVDHNTGDVNGVRYTADSTADPHLIYETLMKFLEL